MKNTTTAAAELVTLAPLPEGFADPQGDLYVPEDARDAYQRITDDEALQTRPNIDWEQYVTATRRAIARGCADRELAAEQVEYPTTVMTEVSPGGRPSPAGVVPLSAPTARELDAYEGWRKKRDAREQDIEHSLRFSPLPAVHALHALRLAEAIRRTADQARVDAAADSIRQSHTCPLCGEFDLTGNGMVEVRSVLPWVTVDYADDAYAIRSCASCHAVAVAEATASRLTPARLRSVRAALGVKR